MNRTSLPLSYTVDAIFQSRRSIGYSVGPVGGFFNNIGKFCDE